MMRCISSRPRLVKRITTSVLSFALSGFCSDYCDDGARSSRGNKERLALFWSMFLTPHRVQPLF